MPAMTVTDFPFISQLIWPKNVICARFPERLLDNTLRRSFPLFPRDAEKTLHTRTGGCTLPQSETEAESLGRLMS